MSFTHRRAEHLRSEADHATAVACCTTCQSAPGYDCHHPDGSPAPVHDARYDEARGTAA